jgi:hypothetical protein
MVVARFNFKVNRKSVGYALGSLVAVSTILFLCLAFETWLLAMILSWFAVQLTFWQCFAIIVLVNCFIGTLRNND